MSDIAPGGVIKNSPPSHTASSSSRVIKAGREPRLHQHLFSRPGDHHEAAVTQRRIAGRGVLASRDHRCGRLGP